MDGGEGNVGFEEGMYSWLPSNVLDEACDTKIHLRYQKNQEHRHRFKTPAETLPPHSKSSLKPHHRSKHHANWASGGPGMQAIFLDSGRKSCGTGVFLPRRIGNDLQPSKKPACAPVLLPSRVVQALNLNVHELGLQLSPRIEIKNIPEEIGDQNSNKNKEDGKDVSNEFCAISQKQCSSSEIFLPKEWTY